MWGCVFQEVYFFSFLVEFATVAFWALTASTKSPWFPPSSSLLCFSLLVRCVGAARVWGVCNHGEHRRTPDTPVGHLKGEELPICPHSADDSTPILLMILPPFYWWFYSHSTDHSTHILLMILLPFYPHSRMERGVDQPAVQVLLASLKIPPYLMFEECTVEGETEKDLVPHRKLDLVIGEGIELALMMM